MAVTQPGSGGLVHTAGVTTGKVHDAKVMANLIREDDTAVYGDKGYAGLPPTAIPTRELGSGGSDGAPFSRPGFRLAFRLLKHPTGRGYPGLSGELGWRTVPED